MASAFRRKETPTDYFDPVTDPDAIERVSVTETFDRSPDSWLPPGAVEDPGMPPDIAALMESGERIRGVPFSAIAPGQPGRVLRGTIDCLIHRADGSVVVIEFKTGEPAPSHQAQLDLYLWAVRAMFPGAAVTGRLVYQRPAAAG